MYKKYIVKNGKKIGPYYYTTARQKDGRIRSIYLGRKPHQRGTHLDRYAIVAVIIFIIGGAFLFDTALRADVRESFMNAFFSRSNVLTGAFVLEGGALDSTNVSKTTTINEPIAKEFVVERAVNIQLTAGAVYNIQIPANTTLTSLRATGSVRGGGSGALKVENMTLIKWYFLSNETVANETEPTEGIVPGITKGLENESLKGKKQINQSENQMAVVYFNQSCVETCTLNLTKKALALTAAFNGTATVLIEQLTFFLVTIANVSEAEIIVTMETPVIQKLAQQVLLAKKPKKVKTNIVQTVLESYQNKPVERGPDWVRSCDNGCRMTLFSSPVHIMDIDGKYKPLTEAVVFDKLDEKTLILKWKDYNIKLKMTDEHAKDLPNLQTQVDNNLIDYEFISRYKLMNTTIKPTITVESNKDLMYDGAHIYLDGIELSFEDTIAFNNFNVTTQAISAKEIKVKLDKDYRAFNQSIGDEIEIDPTIRLSGNQTNNTYDNDVDSNLQFGTATAATMRVGQSDGCGLTFYRSFIDWNTTLIPDSAGIVQINLTLSFNTVGAEPTVSITDMNNRSEGRSASSVYDDAGAAKYVSKDISSGGSQSFILGSTANNALEKNLSINEFNVGIKSSEDVDCLLQDCVCVGPNTVETREATSNRPLLTVDYNMPPVPQITGPANATTYRKPINISLNVLALDTDLDNMMVRLFAAQGEPLGVDDLLHEFIRVQNGTSLTYNVTAIPFQNQSSTIALFRVDNDTNFNEPSVPRAYDHTGNNRNFTVVGGTRSAVGKFAGALRPLEDGALIYSQDCPPANPDNRCEFVFKHNITMMMWYNTTSKVNTGDDYLYSQNLGTTGFAIFRNGARLSILSDGRVSNFSNFFSDDTYIWHHLAVVLRDGNIDVYQDGRFFGNDTINAVTPSAIAGTIIGSQHNGITFVNFFNGSIDDVAIINRSFTASQVNDVAWLKSGWYVWAANITDAAGLKNGSEVRSFRINTFPNVTSVSLTPSPANTTDLFTCAIVVNDDSDQSIDASVKFYNGSFNEFGSDCPGDSCTLTNGTSTEVLMGLVGTQAKHENWTCGVFDIQDDIYTSHGFGSARNSSNVSVVNSPPNPITLFEPVHGNVTTNVRQRFRWSYVDPDNDPVNFSLQIICYNGTSNAKCPYTGDDRNVTIVVSTVSGNATVLPNNFLYYKDDNFYYNWTVNGTDGENATGNARPNNFSEAVVVDFSTYIANVSFGTKSINDEDNTLDNTPLPIKIRNNGNARINIDFAVDDDLFTGIGRPNYAWQLAANETGDSLTEGSFGTFNFNAINKTLSTTDFINLIDAGTGIPVRFLNFSAGSNLTALHINITVPSAEPAGNKFGLLRLTASYGGYI